VQEVGCAAWQMVEVEEEQLELHLRPGVIYAFVTGFVTESSKAGPGEGAWFVLYPAVVAVAVAVKAVVAERVVDLKVLCSGEVEHLGC
jgi:hypothetical protein